MIMWPHMLMTYALWLKIQAKIIQTLKEDYKLKVKSDGPLSYHLGATYTWDKDNTLVCQPTKYIDRLGDSYQSMFKQDLPRNMRTGVDKNDHPEFHTLNYSLGSLSKIISP